MVINALLFRRILQKLIFFLVWIILSSSNLFSKNNSISFDFKSIKLKNAIDTLIYKHNIPIAYPDVIYNPIINALCKDCNEDDVIKTILVDLDLKWEKKTNQYIIFPSDNISQFSISGIILDINSKEPIPYAHIFNLDLNIGEISNENGEFSILNISAKSCTLNISYIGYKTTKEPLSFKNNNSQYIKVNLEPKVLQTPQVSILGSNKEFMDKSGTAGQLSFSPKHISSLPNLGEIDIFRSLQFLPGIQLGTSGTSGLYIRGGTPDQNLITIDGMTIYHTDHLFGFLSSIPPDVIKNIQVYKGNIPSEFGGRVSSLIRLTTRSGDGLKPHIAYYSNFMSNGFTFESPLSSRLNFIINFRKSFEDRSPTEIYQSIEEYVTGDDQFNLISESIDSQDNRKSNYSIKNNYEDIISRVSYLLSPRHRLSQTRVYGRDKIIEKRDYLGFENILTYNSISFKEKTNWSNTGDILTWSSRWNQTYNSQLSISNYKYHSDYSSSQYQLDDYSEKLLGSSNEDNLLKKRTIKFYNKYKGLEKHTISSTFEESYFKIFYNNDVIDGLLINQNRLEQIAYINATSIEDDWTIDNWIKVQIAHRLSYFSSTEKFYSSPRVALIVKPKQNFTLEFSFNKLHQFIHRFNNINNTRGIQNMWILSSKIIPSITSYNSHAGIHLENENYSIVSSLYHRTVKDIFQLNQSLYEAVLSNKKNKISFLDLSQGSGISHGFEFLIRKKRGILSGWISYQFNKTKHQFNEINNAIPFLANHDKSHEVKTVMMTRFLNWDLSAVWVLSSGAVYTSEKNIFINSGFKILTNQDKNTKRVEPTHHLDISFSKSINTKYSLIEVGLSIYNVYNQKNINHKRYNPYNEDLMITDVFMFGFTPTLFFKTTI